MEYWMYMPASAGQEDLRLLKEAGFKGIMGAGSLAKPALAEGLEVMLCGGAFPIDCTSSDVPETNHLAIDINGQKQVWFHSCCPNHLPTRQKNLEMYHRLARTPGISGVIIDGARFSSPASSENPDGFFTCFCPRCQSAMTRLGYDKDRIIKAVRRLYDWLFKGGAKPDDWTGLQEWFSFRAESAGSHIKDFAAVVHAVPGLKAGAFFFAPSLAPMVGQSYSGQADTLDLISPMLYPSYQVKLGDPGTACLNRELAAIARMLTQNGALSQAETERFLARLMNSSQPLPVISLPLEVPRTLIRSETALAAQQAAPAKVLPILQLDDPNLLESICRAKEGGAEELAFFIFRKDSWQTARPLLEKM